MRKMVTVPLALLIGLSICTCSSDSDDSTESTSSPISLVTPSGTLHGTLELPTTEKIVPVFLIVAGSGPTDRDGNSAMLPGKNDSLKMLAEVLAQNGFASVRYDKRGIGESKDAGLNEEDLRFDDLVDDAVAWISQLRDDNRFSKIGIIGHSEGSLIGVLATSKTNPDAYISLEGAGYPAYEIIQEQLTGQPEAIVSEVNRINIELIAGNTVQDIDPSLYSLFRPSIQPYLISWYKYSPATEIAKLTCPVLIVQGTTDIQVKTLDAELLKAANPNSVYALIKGMNHILKDAPLDQAANVATYSNPDLPLSADFLNALMGFIKDVL
ncbi:MAG: alpha/beta hydrolase [Planctomycetes bacterium]|nr:alpha/beta hydrolase [Planctomycetota bacterium]